MNVFEGLEGAWGKGTMGNTGGRVCGETTNGSEGDGRRGRSSIGLDTRGARLREDMKRGRKDMRMRAQGCEEKYLTTRWHHAFFTTASVDQGILLTCGDRD